MLITLNYDPSSGEIKDNHGAILINWVGLEDHETKENSGELDPETLVLLKVEGGYTVDEIVQLRKKGML